MPTDLTQPDDQGPQGFAKDLVFELRSLSRLIYVVTEEEDVFLKRFKSLVKKYADQTQVYSTITGMIPLEAVLKDWKSKTITVKPSPNGGVQSIYEALEEIYKADPKDAQTFYIFTDPELHLSDPSVQRRVLEILHQLHGDEHNVKILIWLSNRKYIPTKLARYFRVVEDKGLSAEDIKKTLERPCNALEIPIPVDAPAMFRGMTSFEIDQAVSQSVVRVTEDPSIPQEPENLLREENIHAYRAGMLKKTGLLEYIDTTSYSQADVGGTERFKEWATETKAAFTEEGRAFGVKVPRGVLLAGVWGTGKSLSAKTLGSEWGLPLVLLEMGKLRSSGVGDTEANVYAALKMIEAVAPCILWMDEAEKSLSGGQSSAQTDSGTTARALGIFSTWIQETKLTIPLVLTANRLSTLPVEFVNRMNERWFFDLPTHDERLAILKIHLRKNRQDPANYNLARLSASAKQMVGREIEQVIETAMLKSFLARKRTLDEDILDKLLKGKSRIVKTMGDEVKELTDWVGRDDDALDGKGDGIKAHFASNPERGTDGKFKGGAFEIVQGNAAAAAPKA
jgi:AAA+ superfamily predicted ATPase